MPMQTISIEDILIDDSRFSTNGSLYEPYTSKTSPIDSFRQLGILYPIVVYENGERRLHLIDGRKRIQFVRETLKGKIDAIVLPHTTPVTDIITLILNNKRNTVEQSIMNKVQFINFAMHLNVPETWMLDSLCVSFGFKPYSGFLKDCERISLLPETLKMFCHEKKYSLKQIVNLTHYPEEILLQVMAWGRDIQLTASVLEEIASNLKDYLRAQKITLKDFLDELALQGIICSSLSPRDKAERLREFIRLKRFPILSEVNARMEKTVESMHLPKEISLSWDRTLENRNVDVTIHMKDISEYDGLLKTLDSSEMKQAVERILDEL
ncbi:MAG: hypothetical protein C4538_09630 [Nitrospiraceae bacterium]|nr:MAG: hypothetical protein C4538_09630 [Nitrospiraceae bacterium]